MRRRLLSNRGLDEYLVFQTKSYDTTFDACLKNMPTDKSYSTYYSHWDKIIPKTQTYTTIKIYSKNKKYKVECRLNEGGGTVYIGTSLSSTSTTYTSTSLGATETTLYINHGVTPARHMGYRGIYIYIQEDGASESYHHTLYQERNVTPSFKISLSASMPYKSTNPKNIRFEQDGLSSGYHSFATQYMSADSVDNIYKDEMDITPGIDLITDGLYYGVGGVVCRITTTSGGDWGIGARIRGTASDIGSCSVADQNMYNNDPNDDYSSPQVKIFYDFYTQWWYGYPSYSCTFDGATGGGSVTFEFYNSDYEDLPEKNSKGNYVFQESNKFLEVEIPYYYTVGTVGSVSTPSRGGLSFALTPQFVHNASNGLTYTFTKEYFVPMFNNYSGGTPYFMFGVWRKDATTYTPSTSLWRMYLGSYEDNWRRIGFYDRTYGDSYTDISQYGIELLNGSSVDFADNSYRDYGNITWINGATSGVYQGAFWFKLTDGIINKITNGLSDDTELVVGIYSQKLLYEYRGVKNDGFDYLPANGYRSDPNVGDSPWIYTAINDGPYIKNGTCYYTTTVGRIKIGGSGFNAALFSMG